MAVDLGNGSAARRQQWLQRDLEPGADRDPAEASAEAPAAPRAARPADPVALSRLLPPSPRDPNAQRARWGRDPESARRDPSPAGVRQPVQAAPAAPLSPPTTTPAAPRRNVGERAAPPPTSASARSMPIG